MQANKISYWAREDSGYKLVSEVMGGGTIY